MGSSSVAAGTSLARKIATVCWVGLCLAGVGVVFWIEDWRYALPTTKPTDYTSALVGVVTELPPELAAHAPRGRPALLHFFNPECPCSRFNYEHVRRLACQFDGSLSLVLVAESADRLDAPPPGFDAPTVHDSDGRLADTFGVYATPMAVVLDAQQRLVYVGNYSSGRFCVDPAREYVRLTLEALERGEACSVDLLPPVYGCPLPSDRTRREESTR